MPRPYRLKVITLFALIAGSFGALALPLEVHAGDQENVVLSPIEYSVNVAAGQEIQTSFSITNNTAQAASLNLTLAEFISVDSQLQLQLAPVNTQGWVSVDKQSTTVQPNQSIEFVVSASIPAGTTSGEYYPVILAQWTNSDQTDVNGASIDSRLAFKLLINVLGEQEVAQTIQIVRLSASSPVINGVVNIDYEIKNTSSLFTRPVAYLQIVDSYGYPVYRETINDQQQILAAGNSLIDTISVDLREIGSNNLGNFSTELLVVDHQFSRSDILTANFLVFPLIYVAIALLIVVIVIVGVYIRKRARSLSSHE